METIDLPHRNSKPTDDGQEPVTELQETGLSELEEALSKIRQERDDLQDQLLRTMAEFQNYRKRTMQEMEQSRAYAAERLVGELLPVVDNFERTIRAAESGASIDSILEGVRGVDRQIRAVLDSQNVSRIPSVGQHFDPEFHEAIAMEHSEEHEEGMIIHELESGYRIADRVIRPARVKVAKRK
jgi:molecular chaperone GrpE